MRAAVGKSVQHRVFSERVSSLLSGKFRRGLRHARLRSLTMSGTRAQGPMRAALGQGLPFKAGWAPENHAVESR